MVLISSYLAFLHGCVLYACVPICAYISEDMHVHLECGGRLNIFSLVVLYLKFAVGSLCDPNLPACSDSLDSRFSVDFLSPRSLCLDLAELPSILRGSGDLNSSPCLASPLHNELFPLPFHALILPFRNSKRRDIEKCSFPEKDKRSSR